MKSVIPNGERAMEELIQGRELASQLISKVFENRSFVVDGDEGGSAEGIVNKILGSFVNTLLIIKGMEADQEFVSDQSQGSSSGVGGGGTDISGGGTGVSDGGSGVGGGGTDISGGGTGVSDGGSGVGGGGTDISGGGTGVSDGGSGGGGGGGDGADSSSWDANHDHAAVEEITCKNTSTLKDRRGSYKRRKTSHSWIRDTPALTYDGHAWRKYGQKVIHNAKHSRNYFRCTHKSECKATKHVQKIQDHPPMFRTTYFGNHTCRDYLSASELVLDSTSPKDSSNFICFDKANCLTNKEEHPFFSSFTSSVKNEVFVKEDMPTTDHMLKSDHNHSSPRDHLVSNDLTVFESSGPMSGFSYDYDNMFSKAVESYFDTEVLQYGF